MFERYTQKARRVIFFARSEASQFGSPYIETEHLLLGLLRDKMLTNRFLRSHASVESIRKQIEGHTTIREKVSSSVDLPLSNECMRVLDYAAEEADQLSHQHIGTEHLLLGLLSEKGCFAAEILHERGLRLSALREELARSTQEKPSPQSSRESSMVSEFSRFLMLLSLVTWLGGIIFFSFVVAPTVFAVLPTRHLAGSVVTRALGTLHWMGIVSGVVFAATSMLYSHAVQGAAQPPAPRHLLVYGMILLTLISQFGISPKMAALRVQMGEIDTVPATDARRVEFNRLHAWSTRLEGSVFLLGLALLYLTARRLS